MDLKKKYGPLPLWAWGLAGVVAMYLYYRHASASSSTTISTAASNTGIDPVTGVPYADEESAFQNEAASALAPGSGGSAGSVDTTGAGTSPDLGQEIQDVTGLITSLQTSGLIPNPGSGSTSTGATTTGTNASTPTTAPSTNGRTSTGTLLHLGAILAPFGSTAPPARAGYTAVGTGNGNWQYVPNSLVNVAGGYLFGSVSHNAPTAPTGFITRGLGNGLWEFIPKPKSSNRPKTTAGRH